MMASTHRLGGIAVGTTAAALLQTSITGTVVILIGSLIGSIFPDIDNRNSRISRKMPITALVVSVGQYLIRIVTSFLPKEQRRYIRSLSGHRGITHSIIGSMILPTIIFLIGILFKQKVGTLFLAGFGVFIGCLSHLILDMLSGGVPLLMPFLNKRVVLANIKTGGRMEWLFRIGLGAALLLAIIH